MGKSPDENHERASRPFTRRQLLRFIVGGTALPLLSSACTDGFDIRKIRDTLDAAISIPETIRQRHEREALFRLGSEIYHAISSHTVGLALAGSDGKAELRGQAVVVQRVGPDNRIYRAILTAKHVVTDHTSGRYQLFVLPRQVEPENLDRFSSGSVGVNEDIDTANLPSIASDRWVLDPEADLAAIPLSGIQGFRDLLDLPGIEIDTRELREGDPTLSLTWTHGNRTGWHGLRPVIGEVLKGNLLDEIGGGRVGEESSTAPQSPGDSGGGRFRLDNSEQPKKALLAGIISYSSRGVGYGSIIIDAQTISRFLRDYATEINRSVR